LVGAIPFLCQEKSLNSETKINQKEKEEELEIPLQDRMDLAMQQEFELTKDPAMNTVPRERLMYALDYSKQLRRVQNNYRTSSAIPGVNWTERGPNNIG